MDVFELALECINGKMCKSCRNHGCINNRQHRKISSENVDIVIVLIDCAKYIRHWMDRNQGVTKAILDGQSNDENKKYYYKRIKVII